MNAKYVWARIVRKISGTAIQKSFFEKPSKIESQSTFINSSIGKYSYCGYGCFVSNTKIGRFCSISDNVSIGVSNHPTDWVSTSPAFYYGRDSIPKNLASLEYNNDSKVTTIGNDVWIGRGVFIKSGVHIGDGAIIGMGSVVTKDVDPYQIVAGNPAKKIRSRFNDESIKKLLKIQWWNLDNKYLKRLAPHMNDLETFFEYYEKIKDRQGDIG